MIREFIQNLLAVLAIFVGTYFLLAAGVAYEPPQEEVDQ